jgi:hypothetical protein
MKQRRALRALSNALFKKSATMLFCVSCLFLLRTGDTLDSIIIHPTPNMAGYFCPWMFFTFGKQKKSEKSHSLCA